MRASRTFRWFLFSLVEYFLFLEYHRALNNTTWSIESSQILKYNTLSMLNTWSICSYDSRTKKLISSSVNWLFHTHTDLCILRPFTACKFCIITYTNLPVCMLISIYFRIPLCCDLSVRSCTDLSAMTLLSQYLSPHCFWSLHTCSSLSIKNIYLTPPA